MKTISKKQKRSLYESAKKAEKFQPVGKKTGWIMRHFNQLAIAFLIVSAGILLLLKETVMANSTFNFLALFFMLLILTAFFVVRIQAGPADRHELIVRRIVGIGYTVNPRNPIGFLMFLVLFLISVFSFVGKVF